jgi:RIO kinase 1
LSSDDFSRTIPLADLEFAVPAFAGLEPGPDQRWTTWPSTMPSERGPQPFPDWLVTSSGAFDTELGIVKSGKEADVFLLERGEPDHPERSCILAAKRYRGAEVSDFHRAERYQEGRRMRNTRDARAVARGSSYGRSVAAGRWARAEFDALCLLHEAGVAVPYPVQVHDTELLMEFIGEGREAAPRLAQTRSAGDELRDQFEQVVTIMRGFARVGSAHGDLSPYNLLVHRGRVVVIDLPQLVDVVANPGGMSFLERDCANICDWFTRRGLERYADELLADLVAELFD